MTTVARASAGVGLIGLAVMGQNLALNMAEHGDPLGGLVGAARATRVRRSSVDCGNSLWTDIIRRDKQ